MERIRRAQGELVLLGVFTAFIVAFLWDIRGLPLEGKLLSYIAAPIALLLIGYRAFRALVPSKDPGSGEAEYWGDISETKPKSRKRMYLTVGYMLGVFGSVCLLGFYFGIGVMLLLWFVAARRLTVSTVAVAVGMPTLLYGILELFLEVGLPKGFLLTWLSG